MKTISRLLVAVLVVIAGYFFVKTFVNASIYAPGDSAPGQAVDVAPVSAFDRIVGSSTAKTKAQQVRVIPDAYPSRLLIPALGMNANIQETTINSRGAMGVPTNFTDVAWYSRGTVPGETGTAVIDGHYDNGLGLDGVFRHLGDLKPGDDVYIKTHGGTMLHFRVTASEQIPYDDPDTLKIFDPQQARAEIKLVTCGGSWVPADRTYNERVVVTAELVK